MYDVTCDVKSADNRCVFLTLNKKNNGKMTTLIFDSDSGPLLGFPKYSTGVKVVQVGKICRMVIRNQKMLLNENTGFFTRRIGLIHKLSIDSRSLKWSAQDVLLNNCRQILRHSHSWLPRQ